MEINPNIHGICTIIHYCGCGATTYMCAKAAECLMDGDCLFIHFTDTDPIREDIESFLKGRHPAYNLSLVNLENASYTDIIDMISHSGAKYIFIDDLREIMTTWQTISGHIYSFIEVLPLLCRNLKTHIDSSDCRAVFISLHQYLDMATCSDIPKKLLRVSDNVVVMEEPKKIGGYISIGVAHNIRARYSDTGYRELFKLYDNFNAPYMVTYKI